MSYTNIQNLFEHINNADVSKKLFAQIDNTKYTYGQVLEDIERLQGYFQMKGLKKGDKVILLPSGFTTTISQIDTYDGELEEAYPPMSVTMLLEEKFDLSRGDMIARVNNQPTVSQDLEVMVCWFHESPLRPRGKYAILHTTKEVRCIVKDIRYKLNINTLHRDQDDKEINMNDIARVVIRTTQPLFYDSYQKNRITGSIIFVDEHTNETVGAGMII